MNLEPIVNARFLRIVEVDASAVLAGRKQSAMPETETETETGAEAEAEAEIPSGKELGSSKAYKGIPAENTLTDF